MTIETPVCPSCGCSLVRLGITEEKRVSKIYKEKEYLFCCEACVDLFVSDAESLLNETGDLVVCPSCLAEKPIGQTVELDYNGKKIHFCRCPHCIDVFQKDPEYFIKRLSGEIEFVGVFSDGEKCCS